MIPVLVVAEKSLRSAMGDNNKNQKAKCKDQKNTKSLALRD